MTQEEKQLLLKDLSARLPHGVKVWYKYSTTSFQLYATSIRLAEEKIALSRLFNKEGDWFPIVEAEEILIKPYLRPMESMTEEEYNELTDIPNIDIYKDGRTITNGREIDWLNKKMFDYRHLISMGLALPATEGMYN